MVIEPQQSVADIATRMPHATPIFEQHGIDYCCHGHRSLAEACEEKALEVDEVLAQIARATPAGAPPVPWNERPIADLIDHIVVRYHHPLHATLQRLEALARKVVDVHEDERPEAQLPEILDRFLLLRDDLIDHLRKEEEILFPWILEGRSPKPEGPIEVMESEHEAVADTLTALRHLTNGYWAPPHACGSWRALFAGLNALEVELHEHIHLENNVLHRRALDR